MRLTHRARRLRVGASLPAQVRLRNPAVTRSGAGAAPLIGPPPTVRADPAASRAPRWAAERAPPRTCERWRSAPCADPDHDERRCDARPRRLQQRRHRRQRERAARRDAPASEGASAGASESAAASGGTGCRPASVSGDLTLQGWSAGAVEAPILAAGPRRLPGRPTRTSRSRSSRSPATTPPPWPRSSARATCRTCSMSTPARPPRGSTTARSSRWTTTSPSGLRHQRLLPGLPRRVQGPGRQAVRPAQGRQHDRDGLQHRPVRAGRHHGPAHHAGRS